MVFLNSSFPKGGAPILIGAEDLNPSSDFEDGVLPLKKGESAYYLSFFSLERRNYNLCRFWLIDKLKFLGGGVSKPIFCL